MDSQSLCRAALAILDGGSPLVLATMMDQSGSVPRTAGARMLVKPDGGIWGTVGGGRYEAEAITLARRLLREEQKTAGGSTGENHPGAVLEYSLIGVTDMDMICGGTLGLLLEVLPPDARSREMLAAALQAEEGHSPFIFISRFSRHEDREIPGRDEPGDVPIEHGAFCAAAVRRHLYLPEEKKLVPDVADLPENILAAADALDSATPRHVVQASDDYLLELFDRPFRVIIFGGGHVALELAKLAQGVDFPVTVLDDREEFANTERFPTAEVIVPPGLGEDEATACLGSLRVGPRDGIVIVTRGHAHDRDVLAASLATGAGYIGMIGSRSKRTAVYNSMMEKGFSRERIDFVHSPIGIAIGADTPQEIAVSIAAELIQWRKKARDANEGSRLQDLCKTMGCAKK